MRRRGAFRLGSMENTAAGRLLAPLAVYNRRYPQVKLELCGELGAALVAAHIASSWRIDFVS